MMLSIFVLTGIIGSIYLFGHPRVNTSSNDNGNPISNRSYLASAAFINTTEESNRNNFDKFVHFNCMPFAQKDFYFDFLKDEKDARYVLEMGDGVRLIVTQKTLQYRYEIPGTYTIELKQINKGILSLIATKRITVK
jgi:hypothetical protein